MYDFIICEKKLPVPDNFLKLDFTKEPFRTTSLSRNFSNYVISNDGFLHISKNQTLEKIKYNGFLYFSTHFFDDPHTKQYYISFFSSFNQGVLEELSLDGVKEYKIEDYDLNKFIKSDKKINSNPFLKIINFIKKKFN